MDSPVMSLDGPNELSTRNLPEFYGLVAAPTDKHGPIGREGQRPDPMLEGVFLNLLRLLRLRLRASRLGRLLATIGLVSLQVADNLRVGEHLKERECTNIITGRKITAVWREDRTNIPMGVVLVVRQQGEQFLGRADFPNLDIPVLRTACQHESVRGE